MTVSRRTLLRGAIGSGVVFAVGVPACAPSVDPAPWTVITVGSDGRLRVPIERYPDLVQRGGALTVYLPNDIDIPPANAGVLIVHRGDDADPSLEYVAMQASCPHAGCPLGYSATDREVECPCHGSRFRAAPDASVPRSCTGDVVHAPAPQGLIPFPITWEPTTNLLTVDLLGRVAVCGTVLPAAVDGKVTLGLADFPDLATVGGQLVGQPAGVPDKLLVMRVDAATVDTTSAICRHLGCTVGYTPSTMRIDCPCHGSQYALDGSVIHGPTTVSGTTMPLRRYPTAFDGTSVVITVS